MTEAVATPAATIPSFDAPTLLAAALKLSTADRAAIAQQLLATLEPADPGDIEAAWREEVQRRYREIKDGTAVLYDGEQVLKEARRLVSR